MEILQIHNTDNAETSRAHAAETPCSKTLLEKLKELERKHDKDEKAEKNATIFSYPLQTHQKRAAGMMPRMVSIGPFFHGEPELNHMEAIKVELMFDLLSREQACRLLPNLEHEIRNLQKRARNCYSGNVKLDDAAFAEMLLVDSCFIIRFLLSLQEKHKSQIFLNLNVKVIRSDLLLMENQIPLFVVLAVYRIIQESCEEKKLPTYFNDIVGQFIRMDTSWGVSQDVSCMVADHLLDLYWLFFTYDETEIKSRLHYGRCTTRGDYIYNPVGATRNLPSASELNRVAGVIFKQDKSSSVELHRADGVLLKPEKSSSLATFRNGIFEMSSLKIDENTKIILVNLVAYEEIFQLNMRKVSSYMLLMNSLINTEEDVALLQKCGIIVNALDTNLSAAIFFNGIGNMCSVDCENHLFAKLFKDVENHYNSKWKRRFASLRRDYCNNAWARISVLAAVVLLLLTVAQTILGAIQTRYTIHFTKN